MPNGYVSQIQINDGNVQNIGSCAYAVCDTEESVSTKVVTFPNFVLKDGATIHVKFTYRNTAFDPKLNVNGTGAKSIMMNTNSDFDSSLSLSSQYNVDQLWMAGAIVTLTYADPYWVVNNPSRITTPYTYNLSTGGSLAVDSYMILADIEWELCTGSSNVTARVFPFRICMSTMVNGYYRDREAIMEVFVGGCYNKKDYVDIMIHDESEYHVDGNYVFRSLVDSIFIYFEYEVSSGNVIGKRTGHLLGKVPSSWSSFQLVPLTNMSVSSANPDSTHHFLKFDIAHLRSSFEPSESYETSIPSGNVLPTTVGVHRYLIKARLRPFEIGQLSGNGSTAGQYLKSNGSTSAPSWETMDTAPTASSTKAVTSGGIKTALDAKQNAITVTTNTTDPTDDDTIIMQANGVSNTTTFLRRKLSYLWNYIQSKISSVLGLTSTNYGGTSAKATSDASGNVITTTYATLTDLAEKRDKYRLTSSWIGQNVAGTTYGVACRFKLTSVSEARSIFMRINTRSVIHNLRILASSSSIAIGNLQIGTNASDNDVYGYIDTNTGIVTIYLHMRDYREGASVTEFSPANYYYYNSKLTDIEFPNKEYVSTLPTGYVTASQAGWARYDKNGNDISTYYQPVITAGTGLSKSDNTINHSNSVTAQTSNLGSSVRIPAIKYDAQGHITYGTYYDVFSNEQYSVIKCGYINNASSSAGWMKVGEVTYWTGTNQRYTVVISVMGNYVNTFNDFGILRIRLANSSTAGVAASPAAQWLVKTAGNSTRFKTDCIRMVKTETSSSSGVKLSIYMYTAGAYDSYNFQVINEAVSGATKKSHLMIFSNSTTKETTEPSPTYASTMAPVNLGNHSNCLEITDSNWQSYLTASNAGGAVPSSITNGDILTLPEGISQVFFNTTNEASIALVRCASSLNRFPRNGVRISIAGNWKPQENGGYSGSNADGRFSAYLYVYRGGVASASANYRMTHAFEDFMYFNRVWYSKGY